uniref:Uncharacterized protein n=1 Tax=Arion vulgaris TaxID=1028688 RepID=A0A0B6YAV3_9EUPU
MIPRSTEKHLSYDKLCYILFIVYNLYDHLYVPDSVASSLDDELGCYISLLQCELLEK